VILRNALAGLKPGDLNTPSYKIGYCQAIRDAVALCDQSGDESLFEKHCNAARGSEGRHEAEAEITKTKEQRPARDMLKEKQRWPHYSPSVDAFAIIEAIDTLTEAIRETRRA
jgi:hypothetical protein